MSEHTNTQDTSLTIRADVIDLFDKDAAQEYVDSINKSWVRVFPADGTPPRVVFTDLPVEKEYIKGGTFCKRIFPSDNLGFDQLNTPC